jgi:hypothetical protein
MVPFSFRFKSINYFQGKNAFFEFLFNDHCLLCLSFTDRYVIIGNHRDAWSYGAQDPGTGTAVLSAIVEAFGNKHKNGGKKKIF